MNARAIKFRVLTASLAVMAVVAGCSNSEQAGGESATNEGVVDYERGPHGGRILRDGDFAVELKIFEEGVPPEYHAYGSFNDIPLAPAEFDLKVELSRLGGKRDHFGFRPAGDFLRGDGVVREPHSFDVRVAATRAGKRSEWTYASYEGRTQIPAEIARASGIATEVAGPAVIREQIELSGVIQPRTEKQAEIRARFPGVVRAIEKSIGDTVASGEVLARVQSNESLEEYDIRAPLKGVVLARDARVGEVAGTEPLMVIADLSTVWAELDAFTRDVVRLRLGQTVEVADLNSSGLAGGVVSRIAPQALYSSQSVKVRVDLPNPGGQWRPGQFVRARVTASETEVPLAVRANALQSFRDFTVVFTHVGDIYEVRMLELGRRDREWVEVLGGLDPGERYVTENSFLVKADIEKSGASHDH